MLTRVHHGSPRVWQAGNDLSQGTFHQQAASLVQFPTSYLKK